MTLARGAVIIITIMRSLRAIKISSAGAATALFLLNLVPAGASSANLSRSYGSDTPIQAGSIVSLDARQSDFVVLANSSNASRVVGVAVNSNDSLLAVDPTNGAVQVATSGNVNTLVSTLNGNINVGDHIAVSPFNGVGMKAAPGSYVVGLAQTSFSASSDGAQAQEVTTTNGQKQRIYAGYVRLSIAISQASSDTGSGQKLTALQKLAQSLTGHTISNIRVIIALIISVIAILALITLIYAAIYSSIISIGRNPLAKYQIFQTLGSVIGMVVAIGIVAGLSVFLLLS